MKAILGFCAIALALAPFSVRAAEMDCSGVDKAFGKKGSPQPGEVYRVTFPRTDLQVTLDGTPLKPGFALGTHFEFVPTGNQAMVMGDLVLTDAEINPVMQKLIAGGIEITAMHFWAQDDAVKLAKGLKAALDKSNIKRG